MVEKKSMERLHAREVVLFKKNCRGEATKAELVELKELRCIKSIHSFLAYSSGNEDVLLEKYFAPIQDWKGDWHDCPAQNAIDELGEEHVRELFKEEVKYFKEHAVVIPCSVVGSEGELYHTVTYI